MRASIEFPWARFWFDGLVEGPVEIVSSARLSLELASSRLDVHHRRPVSQSAAAEQIGLRLRAARLVQMSSRAKLAHEEIQTDCSAELCVEFLALELARAKVFELINLSLWQLVELARALERAHNGCAEGLQHLQVAALFVLNRHTAEHSS